MLNETLQKTNRAILAFRTQIWCEENYRLSLSQKRAHMYSKVHMESRPFICSLPFDASLPSLIWPSDPIIPPSVPTSMTFIALPESGINCHRAAVPTSDSSTCELKARTSLNGAMRCIVLNGLDIQSLPAATRCLPCCARRARLVVTGTQFWSRCTRWSVCLGSSIIECLFKATDARCLQSREITDSFQPGLLPNALYASRACIL